MATFRSIKELTRALQQGSKLLSNMFLQRKTIAVKYDDALDTQPSRATLCYESFPDFDNAPPFSYTRVRET